MTNDGGLQGREADLNPLRHALPRYRHDDIFRVLIVPTVLDVTPPVTDPSAVILGGRAGSGKTYLKRSLLRRAERAAADQGRPFAQPVDLGTDEFRDFHPDWRRLLAEDDVTAAFYTTADCRAWCDEAISYCIKGNPHDPGRGGPKPFILDTQLNDPDRVARLLHQLRDARYPVHVVFAAAPAAMSRLSALDRYWQMRQELGGGRYAASPEKSDPGILASARLIDDAGLADTVEIYPWRGVQPVYRNELSPRGAWREQPRTAEVLAQQWNRPWTRQETHWLVARAETLAANMGPRWWPEIAQALRLAEPHKHPSIDTTTLLTRLTHSPEQTTASTPAPGPAEPSAGQRPPAAGQQQGGHPDQRASRPPEPPRRHPRRGDSPRRGKRR